MGLGRTGSVSRKYCSMRCSWAQTNRPRTSITRRSALRGRYNLCSARCSARCSRHRCCGRSLYRLGSLLLPSTQGTRTLLARSCVHFLYRLCTMSHSGRRKTHTDRYRTRCICRTYPLNPSLAHTRRTPACERRDERRLSSHGRSYHYTPGRPMSTVRSTRYSRP
jgi:hypothetical protein